VTIVWSPLALDRAYDIAAYIAEDKPDVALSWIGRLFDSVATLRQQPHRCRVVPELGRNHIRELILGQYRVIFQIRDDVVQVLTVRHGRRLLDLGELDES